MKVQSLPANDKALNLGIRGRRSISWPPTASGNRELGRKLLRGNAESQLSAPGAWRAGEEGRTDFPEKARRISGRWLYINDAALTSILSCELEA